MTACGFTISTSGLQNANLGSDEADIVLLGYAIVDMDQNQVLGIKEYVIKPTKADINFDFLSNEVRVETRLTKEVINSSGISLSEALVLFEDYCFKLGVQTSSLNLVTNGQLPLRQCLHLAAVNKDMTLPKYYNQFIDIRKEIQAKYAPDLVFKSILDIVKFLNMSYSEDTKLFSKELMDMVNIIQRVVHDGNKFVLHETIQLYLEPKIFSRNEKVDPNCVAFVRGLPYKLSEQEVANFFRGLNIAKGGVAFCISKARRRNGDAYIRFISEEHCEMALKRHMRYIGPRYIEVFKATDEDFINIVAGPNNVAWNFLAEGAKVIIIMRGLPYECTAEQIIEFFESGVSPCLVMNGEGGIYFLHTLSGLSTGNALALFKEEEDAPKALSYHKESIGNRYIEIFRSSYAEVQQLLNKSPHIILSPIKKTPLPPVALQYYHKITLEKIKDFIRLNGMPYEVQIENIIEFLGKYSKNILFQGIHMMYNEQCQPIGKAFIQMNSDASAAVAALNCNHRYMKKGQIRKSIEVTQCSRDDISLEISRVNASQWYTRPSATQEMFSAAENHIKRSDFCNQSPYPINQSFFLSGIPLATPTTFQPIATVHFTIPFSPVLSFFP